MCFALTLLLATYFSLEIHSQDFIVGLKLWWQMCLPLSYTTKENKDILLKGVANKRLIASINTKSSKQMRGPLFCLEGEDNVFIGNLSTRHCFYSGMK